MLNIELTRVLAPDEVGGRGAVRRLRDAVLLHRDDARLLTLAGGRHLSPPQSPGSSCAWVQAGWGRAPGLNALAYTGL